MLLLLSSVPSPGSYTWAHSGGPHIEQRWKFAKKRPCRTCRPSAQGSPQSVTQECSFRSPACTHPGLLPEGLSTICNPSVYPLPNPAARPSWPLDGVQWAEIEGSRRLFVAIASAVEPKLRQLIGPRECQWQCLKASDGGQGEVTEPMQEEPARSMWRRRALLAAVPGGLATSAFLVPMWSPISALAAASTAAQDEPSLARQLLRGLGIGDVDLYYPRFFEGVWDCNATLISVDTPQGLEAADVRNVEQSRKQLGFAVPYQAKFLAHQGRVVADRLFTTKSLVESTVGPGTVVGGDWSVAAPDRLVLTLRGGIKVENQVTKRSADLSAPGQFDTSEFSRQVFDNPTRVEGPPSVKASQNLTRYRWDASNAAPDEMEAIQRISMYAVPGAGGREVNISDLDAILLSSKPVTIYKYYVRFTRQKGLVA